MGKYHCTVDLLFDWFGISCMTTDNFCFYLQSILIQTSQTEGQPYSDTSPFSIPCTEYLSITTNIIQALRIPTLLIITLGAKCRHAEGRGAKIFSLEKSFFGNIPFLLRIIFFRKF